MAGKGPGKNYRTGITLIQLGEMFPDDATAQAWFERQRWPNGPFCPRCGSFNVQAGIKHKTMTHRCRDCQGKPMFTLRTGTPLEGSKVGYKKWAYAIYLLTTGIKGTSSLKLHRDIGVTQKTAWFMMHRLRTALKAKTEPFTGPVEADETFVGGKESNKHASRKLHAGGGTVGKTAVAGVKDRATGQVNAQVVPDTTGPTLRGFVRDHTHPGALVYTDEALAYRGLPYHEAVKHSVSEWVNDQAHTNGLESLWASLKRGYHGVYHHMSPKHLDRYVGEFTGRHNERGSDTIDQMSAIVRDMAGQRLRYTDLTAGGPAYPKRRAA